jgi:glycerol-3-phosphate O-acyltransferase
MLTARHFLKRKYGKIYIRFGQPISLETYLTQKGIHLDSTVQPLAFDLIRSINKATLVTPLALLATVILTKHRRGFQANELIYTINLFLKFFNHYNIPLAPSLDNIENALDDTLSVLVGKKVIHLLEETPGEDVLYSVEQEKITELDYYKNSIIHFLISHSFVAVSLLMGTEDEKSYDAILDDYVFQRNLFRYEFVYSDMDDIHSEAIQPLSYFSDVGYIIKSDGTGRGYKPTRLGHEELPIWAALTRTFLESYWITARSYLQVRASTKKKSDQLKQINQMGLQYHKLGFVDHIEGVSQISFENANRVINEEITRTNETEVTDESTEEARLKDLTQRIYNLSHY